MRELHYRVLQRLEAPRMEVTGSYHPYSIDHEPTLAVYGIGCSSGTMPYALWNNEAVVYLVICLAHVEK